MTNHPNALAGGGSSLVVAAIVYLLSLIGVSIPEPPLAVGIFLGGCVCAVVLFIGREGLRGVFRLVWQGRSRS